MSTNITESIDYNKSVVNYLPVIGIEVHIALSTETKMFCNCFNKFGCEPNTLVCPVCLGLPGSLPVLNKSVVESSIKTGLALNCEIAQWSQFVRKNYFYPDQPKNFQISQYEAPIAFNGFLNVLLKDNFIWKVEIERAHMEEDTGKLTYIGSDNGRIAGATTSLADYNRSGVPLIEIVTKPIHGTGALAPKITCAYISLLKDILFNLGVSDAKMDQGSMRCDINISLNRANSNELGVRTETKNLNSLKNIYTAVKYEIIRQAAILNSGNSVIQETRHFHENGYTLSGRNKETAQDYRYFPEPDLKPVISTPKLIEKIRQTIPELPWVINKQLQYNWNISEEIIRDLVSSGAIELIIVTVEYGISIDNARAWWGNFLAQKANELSIELKTLPITPLQLALVIKLIKKGSLSNTLARKVIESMLQGEGEPEEVIKFRNLFLLQDDLYIENIVSDFLATHKEITDKVRNGKLAAVGVIIGSIMKTTKGAFKATKIREIILKACKQIN